MARLSFKSLARRAAQLVNDRLGESCTYFIYGAEEPLENVQIIIAREDEARDQMGNLVVPEIQGSALKSQLPQRPDDRDYLVDSEGQRYRVSYVLHDNPSKWYFYLIEVSNDDG